MHVCAALSTGAKSGAQINRCRQGGPQEDSLPNLEMTSVNDFLMISNRAAQKQPHT